MSGAESEFANHRPALRSCSTERAFAKMVCIALGTIALCTSAIIAQDSSPPPPALSILLQALGRTEDPAAQLNLLRGMNAALKGRRNVTAPPEWPALAEKLAQSANAEVKEQAQTLGAVFGSSGAFDAMRATVTKSDAEPNARLKALESLVAAQDKSTLPILQQLVKEPGVLRRTAIRGLAAYDDQAVPGLLLGAYASFDSDEKRDAIGTLLARIPWARRLVGALEKNEVARTDLAAPHLRQLAGLKDPLIEAWVQRNPDAFAATGNRQAEIVRYKSFLTAETIARADRNHGRALFNQICAACHTLFGSGGTNGPELTGANRTDIDYLLQNIIDPNALIGKDYQSTTIETKDGRVIVGMIRGDDANSVTLKTLAEPVIISRNDIKSLTVSDVSMMPEGLLAAFSQEQVRDLFAYLASPRQVPILATPLNAADFFNGSDLARWRPSNDQWRVEDGEIVGRAGGSAPVSLQSEMIAENYVFAAQLKISRADDLAAEIAFRGDVEQTPFDGCSLSLGGRSGVNLWEYGGEKPQSFAGGMIVTPDVWHSIEIRVLGEEVRVMLDGMVAFDVKKTPGGARNGFAFYLGGNGAELRIKEARLEVLAR